MLINSMSQTHQNFREPETISTTSVSNRWFGVSLSEPIIRWSQVPKINWLCLKCQCKTKTTVPLSATVYDPRLCYIITQIKSMRVISWSFRVRPQDQENILVPCFGCTVHTFEHSTSRCPFVSHPNAAQNFRSCPGVSPGFLHLSFTIFRSTSTSTMARVQALCNLVRFVDFLVTAF